MSIQLFDGQAADGDSAVFNYSGGRAVFTAYGTFGGGTCKLQMSPDGGTTWVDVTNDAGTAVSLTSAGLVQFHLSAGVKIKANLASSTGASLNCKVI